MLTELWVQNLAVVERLEARFRPGLNAVTGETGAGKSLVVGALDLVLGGRASADLVRRGAAEADIIARFELDPDHFTSRGLDQSLDEGALVLRRVIAADGRSRAYVNDRPATVGRLKELGATLADLHGQHEQQNLLREETHLDYLDAFAGCQPAAVTVAMRYRACVDARRRLEEFLDRTRQGAEEREFQRHQLAELDQAELAEGEEDALTRERHLAAHAGRLAEAVRAALEDLTEGDPNAEALLARASRRSGQAAELDPELEPLRRQIDEALVAAEEAARELARYADGLNTDPARLEEVEARLALLTALKRKYRMGVGELLGRREELRELLDAEEDPARRRKELEAAVEAEARRLGESCTELSAARSRAAAALSREVTRELRGLGMEAAGFSVALRPPRQGEILPGRESRVNSRGAEEAVFLIAPNPGEAAGPLARIASGGETSRVMLALKNTLRRVDPVPLVIFDEVDAGIGGLVAEAVAVRLASIAGRRQVLVVTHLAVIAGRAGHHLRLVKTVEKRRTQVRIEELDPAGREEELARMLAGSVGGEDARRTARTLLAEGGRS
jgi:DNA repair protein RecN (Recombination protein N)